ncbi:MAG: cobalamin-binding protein [Burkholderiales bacterium]|jgi:iron complex transport system substrate-binding protein|uniref:Cobalamin-binding protein n=1 Tax=Candidatus Desulfobacillus denitrificans TaxID=2608985 RepID=A0A809S1L8_9PROT|nr:Vitamin B12-binding protein [Rhodocyclaceae bacterium]MCZ2419530.1 cobalamin-binding protein [Burkholderiales bacterium]BBO19431.1 cobalamin-binding protein [Candidatus Desulfobacillus denitrificans]GIK45389.1 MAG: cobalamin-binding protein [Betaproteobacteria bacterium]MCC7270924.1 cobalamin-binding protein [Rhodocyclaceae bacterium]
MRTFCLIALLAAAPALADVAVNDESGRTVRLTQPARRIVSLSPHITENLFAIGAGNRVVGTVEFSNYPEEAKKIRQIGGYEKIDLEAVAALRPDLVVAWESGNSASHVAKLRAIGLPVVVTETRRIEDVPADLERLGALSGTSVAARAAAARFRDRLVALRARYAGQPKVGVFYQVWNQPLMTVGGGQIISDAIRLCGGENVFAALKPMAAAVTVEAVLAADPEAIVASGMGDARPEWLDEWRRWPALTAVARDNLFFVHPDHLQRHTPRILDGIERLCQHLETARSRRPRP